MIWPWSRQYFVFYPSADKTHILWGNMIKFFTLNNIDYEQQCGQFMDEAWLRISKIHLPIVLLVFSDYFIQEKTNYFICKK